MNSDMLSRAIGDIDSQYILEAINVTSVRKKGVNIYRVLSVAACFSLIFVLGYIGKQFYNQCVEKINSSSSLSETFVTDKSPYNTTNKIFINEVSLPFINGSGFDIDSNWYKYFTKDELFAFLGVEFNVSDIFPEMIETNTEEYGMYIDPNGTIKVGHTFIWSEKKSLKKIEITPLKEPFLCLGCFDSSEYFKTDKQIEKSIINKTEMVLVHYIDENGEDVYSTNFVYKGVTFFLETHNTSKDEFIDVILYLIQ